MNRQLEIPMFVSVAGRRRSARRGEPVTGAVPLPRGAATDADGWSLHASDGAQLPLQAVTTDRWPDGSVRWLLLDTQVDLPDAGRVPLVLRRQPGIGGRCAFQETASGITVDVGEYVFHLSHQSPALIGSVTGASGQLYDGTAAEIRVLGADGTRWTVEWQRTVIECAGAVRVATLTEGAARGPDGGALALFMRLDFFSGQASVRMRLTIRNPRRAAHPGGVWELGDAGSALLKDVSVILPAAPAGANTSLVLSAEPGLLAQGSQRMLVYQESSGGEHWSSSNHRTRAGVVPFRFRGYQMDVDGVAQTGARATPSVLIESETSALGATVPHFWQNFPRAIEATPAALRISFFPPESPDLHELQGGEQKTHECYVCFARDAITEAPLDWCRQRAVLHASPQWYAESAAVPNLVSADDEEPAYRALADAAIEGADTFEHKREVTDEYGWRHFGDIYGDHEAVKSPTPLMSHYNNQYDPIAGCFLQFIRTGDVRWWLHAGELAAHVADIDIYHTNEDKSAYNHGLFWHTIHYIDAGTSTHRSYPRGTVGGGPSCEHNYPTGLMLHYFVTGDTVAREAALDLTRFVVDLDDGSKTVYRYLAAGSTGYASASRTFDYHGPGRGSGNSLNALVDGHRLTGDRIFLDQAEQLIRRCTHPRQDIGQLTLLDPENRWFYTMYMQSLGRYLHWKIERDELDAMYAYGRDVLLHFARWMADHERPYLERPDLLEFPTETWAAQDIRKSEIFDYAARHAPPDEAARFTERAQFFYRYSVDTLATMPTRTLARPVVLMLVHGLVRAHARTHGILRAPAPRETWVERWPVHRTFIPQRALAVRRAKQIVLAGLVALGGAVALLLTG